MGRARRAYAVALYININHDSNHFPRPSCAGDDANEKPHRLKEQVYHAMNFPLRDVVVGTDLTFCSHDWPVGSAPVGQRIYKSLFNLLLTDPIEPEVLLAFCREYFDHPAFPTVLSITSKYRIEVNMILLELEFEGKMKSLKRERMTLESKPLQNDEEAPQPTYVACAKQKKGIKQFVKQVVKKKAARVARTVVSRGLGAGLTQMHQEMLESLTDPFSDSAANARYPDNGAGKTLTFQQRFTQAIGTDANGTAALCIVAKPNFPVLYHASAASTVVTWPATYSASFDANTNLLNSYGHAFRPTSFGVRISNTLSATDSAGYIVIAKGGPPTVSTTTTFNPTNFTSWDDHPYQHGQEWHTVAAPRAQSAYVMVERAVYATNTIAPLAGWESIYIGIFGSKLSASVAIVDIVMNFEYTANEDAAIAQLAVKQPLMDVGMQTAINSVQSNHLASHKGGTHIIRGFLKKEGKKALLKHVLPFVQKNALKAIAI
jgi:hypothetical protein